MDPKDRSAKFLKQNGFGDIAELGMTAYSEPHRVYHDLRHINSMIAYIDEMVKFFSLSFVEGLDLHLAAWFHDIIYVPGSKDNEHHSAELARKLLEDIYPDSADDIADMVLVTKTHLKPQSFLAAILIDADLAGLGTAKETYYENCIRVQQEYNAHPLLWAQGRRKFLEEYMSRPTLFHTAWGASRRLQAKLNMDREYGAILDFS